MKERRLDITDEMLIATYAKKGCNVTSTCAALNIDRGTFYNWRKNDPELDAKLKYEEESILDFTESKLIEKINDGDLTAIIFMLKTKGKTRGYIEGHILNTNITTKKSMTQEEAIDFIKGLEEEC